MRQSGARSSLVARHPVVRGRETTVVAAWDTSLTYFHPLGIACLEEETDIGGDDIWTRFVFDGPLAPATCRNAAGTAPQVDCLWVSRLADHDGRPDETDEMYDGTTLHEAGRADPSVSLPFDLDAAYQTRVVPNLWQDGEGLGGEQYFFPVGPIEIPPLPMFGHPDRDRPEGKSFFWMGPPREALPPVLSDIARGFEYSYQMPYRLTHARPACVEGPISGCPAGLTCAEGACR